MSVEELCNPDSIIQFFFSYISYYKKLLVTYVPGCSWSNVIQVIVCASKIEKMQDLTKNEGRVNRLLSQLTNAATYISVIYIYIRTYEIY